MNGNPNYEQLHTFFKGWKADYQNHAEQPETFEDAWNGYLYSSDGKLAYVSRQGSRLVYQNANIKKYLGFFAFKDELFVLVKADIALSAPSTTTITITEIVVEDFAVTSDTDNSPITGLDFFDGHYTVTDIDIPVLEPVIDEDDFSQSVSCADDDVVDDPTYNNLFQSYPFLPTQLCSILNDNVPINNLEYADAMITFTYDANGMLVPKIRWVGNLNLPWDAKIVTEGVEENEFYKRVYFSDYNNPSRVVNLKDKKLATRRPAEFNLTTNGILLNPRVNSIRSNGQLRAMTVFYMMRLVTENGQVSDYSPTSMPTRIVANDTGFEFAGGGIDDITNRSVLVDCYIPNHENFAYVELIAVEFAAKSVPTSIKLVGRKPVDSLVQFEHFGSEPEFAENITLADIFANSISWKYNSDYATYNNKLIAAGLRNDPSYVNSKNVSIDFALHGFKPTGETHSCLLNPDPVHYNYIDAGMTESFLWVKRKLFREISVFGSFTMKLINTATGESYDYSQIVNNNSYLNQTAAIFAFLETAQTDVNFATKFPNLEIVSTNGRILFQPIDTLIETDFYNYNLVFSTSQVIMDMDNDFEVRAYVWPTAGAEREARLVYGGISNGWFNGNGVRVTMHSVRDKILSKNTDWMSGSTPPLQLEKPTLGRGCMKGEIYRTAIQWYKNGNKLFSTVLGDLKIPDMHMRKRELNASGQVIPGVEFYSNKVIIGDEMFAERIELQFDVRINCELSKEVDAYQIVFVERTEENRTILAQGISAPLERIIPFVLFEDAEIRLPENIMNTWSLPSHGGPVYDAHGLSNYDNWPNNKSLTADFGGAEKARVTTHRKAFYFDSPDLIYNKISDQYVDSCKLEYLETQTTDHDRFNILTGYDERTSGMPDTYIFDENSVRQSPLSYVQPFGTPKFSQKIPELALAGENNIKPSLVNVSIFANTIRKRYFGPFQQEPNGDVFYELDKSKSANQGEVLSAFQLNDSFDISNNALTLSAHGWFYQFKARKNFVSGYTLFNANNSAAGRPTLFLRTKQPYFSDENIAQSAFTIHSTPYISVLEPVGNGMKAHDAYIVSNLKRNNEDSIYGGRTEFGYASNEYIPMGDVMPVIQNRITSQTFYVQGDTYCTLFLHNKTFYQQQHEPQLKPIRWNYWETSRQSRFQAWCYGVVLESTIEPRLNYAEEFYRLTTSINFKHDLDYNEAYSQENDLRKSIPKPYNFKDDPLLSNIVAVSKTKLSGDSTDAWTQFPTNEFYELDKNMGAALNIVKEKDQVIVVQELQSSQLLIDERSFITPDDGGAAIQVAQGNGTSISGHKPISTYGTSFRRAIVKNNAGFVFFDERKNEFVKVFEPMFLKNDLGFKIKDLFQNNKVVDVEGYYDEVFKESNIRFRTETGPGFIVSYNEILQCFNGRANYDNDLYMVFQETVVAPYADSAKLAQLNTGNELEFFENKFNLKLAIVSAPNYPTTKINKGIAIITNIDYPILKAIFETSLGHIRTVLGTHHWYKFREGVHTLPAKNQTDYTDIRGEWCKIEIEAESQNNKKVKIFSITNFVRDSYK